MKYLEERQELEKNARPDINSINVIINKMTDAQVLVNYLNIFEKKIDKKR